ncbi:hypothetical protein FBULB1_2167 [Fusarium bulbicola]|nr:hypothetical protein FBULB1_2167 [Fusarium bulbicola]
MLKLIKGLAARSQSWSRDATIYREKENRELRQNATTVDFSMAPSESQGLVGNYDIYHLSLTPLTVTERHGHKVSGLADDIEKTEKNIEVK